METGGKKACFRCKEVTPLTGFYKDRRNPDGRRNVCAWCESKRLRKRKVGSDHHRKNLSDASSPLEDDVEQEAYVRGFTKGRAVQEEESEKVASCRDLVFRIASDMTRGNGTEVTFEEMVAYGYEGLLDGIRSYKLNATYPFRRHAAKRIRFGILDRLRQKGTTWRLGGRYGPVSSTPETGVDADGIICNPVGPNGDFEPETIDPVPDDETGIQLSRIARCLTPRHADIVRLRLTGMGDREIGEKLELTESRVCQLRTQVRVWKES